MNCQSIIYTFYCSDMFRRALHRWQSVAEALVTLSVFLKHLEVLTGLVNLLLK